MPSNRPLRKKAAPLATSSCRLRAPRVVRLQRYGYNVMDVVDEILRTQVGRDLLIKEESPGGLHYTGKPTST